MIVTGCPRIVILRACEPSRAEDRVRFGPVGRKNPCQYVRETLPYVTAAEPLIDEAFGSCLKKRA